MLTLFSPAKLNLFLRVLRRREDGFHELASLFQAISLGDMLSFSLAAHDQLTAEGLSVPLDGSNLIAKAVDLFRKNTAIDASFTIHLNKRIPLEAGLGGGSSNAATTLWALNELTGRPATLEQLVAWGGTLGSDVAFFLSSGTAYCTGRGEILKSLEPLPETPSITLVKPPYGSSTPQVYRALNCLTLPHRDPIQYLDRFYENDIEYFNDLETAAFAAIPDLAQLKEELLFAGFEHAVLAGSGSTFFCIGEAKLSLDPTYLIKKVRYLNRPLNSWYSLESAWKLGIT